MIAHNAGVILEWYCNTIALVSCLRSLIDFHRSSPTCTPSSHFLSANLKEKSPLPGVEPTTSTSTATTRLTINPPCDVGELIARELYAVRFVAKKPQDHFANMVTCGQSGQSVQIDRGTVYTVSGYLRVRILMYRSDTKFVNKRETGRDRNFKSPQVRSAEVLFSKDWRARKRLLAWYVCTKRTRVLLDRGSAYFLAFFFVFWMTLLLNPKSSQFHSFFRKMVYFLKNLLLGHGIVHLVLPFSVFSKIVFWVKKAMESSSMAEELQTKYGCRRVLR